MDMEKPVAAPESAAQEAGEVDKDFQGLLVSTNDGLQKIGETLSKVGGELPEGAMGRFQKIVDDYQSFLKDLAGGQAGEPQPVGNISQQGGPSGVPTV